MTNTKLVPGKMSEKLNKTKQNKTNFFQEKKFVLFSKIFRAEAILGKSVFAVSKIQESHKFCFGGVLKKL